MLVDHLRESLDALDQRIDAIWAEEIERRIREIDEGKVEGELVIQNCDPDSEDELLLG